MWVFFTFAVFVEERLVFVKTCCDAYSKTLQILRSAVSRIRELVDGFSDLVDFL